MILVGYDSIGLHTFDGDHDGLDCSRSTTIWTTQRGWFVLREGIQLCKDDGGLIPERKDGDHVQLYALSMMGADISQEAFPAEFSEIYGQSGTCCDLDGSLWQCTWYCKVDVLFTELFYFQAMKTITRDPIYRRHRYPADVIAQAVLFYYRFPLSLRIEVARFV